MSDSANVPSGAFVSLRHPNYRYYFFAQLLSLTGSWTQTTALMWLAYSAENYSSWPSLIAALQVLPGTFLGPWGGNLADRLPRKKLIIFTQCMFFLQSIGLLAASFHGHTAPWILMLFSLLWGVINALDLPARLAFLIEMVGKKDLFNAVALNSLQFNLARLMGPAIGAYLLTWYGPTWCFAVNASSYLILLLALFAMQPSAMFLEKPPEVKPGLLDGFRYLLGKPDLVLIISTAGGMAVLGWPLLGLLPAYASQELAMGQEAYGSLLSGVGGGALGAALLLAWKGAKFSKGLMQATGMLVASIGLLLLSIAGSFGQALPCSILFGSGMILFFATSQGMVQLGAGDNHRGLVLGVWSMMLCTAVPLGNFIAGPLADIFPLRNILVGMAFLMGLLLFTFLLIKTRMKRSITKGIQETIG